MHFEETTEASTAHETIKKKTEENFTDATMPTYQSKIVHTQPQAIVL